MERNEISQQSGITMRALNFTEPVHDSGTLPEVPEQYERLTGREAAEPVIRHLKSDYRLCRNYLKGIVGDQVNLLLNFKQAMNLWRTEANRSWQLIYKLLIDLYRILLPLKNQKLTF